MSELRTRQNIWTLVGEDPANPWHPVVLAYARAIGVLRDRFDDDPTGWTYQAQIHGLFPDPQDGFRNKCQHFSWFFLPWHRMYLFHFESIIRSVVEDLMTSTTTPKPCGRFPIGITSKGRSRHVCRWCSG